ncbi:serine/threonine protein kinase [Cupriavidus basilensis]
MGDGAFCQSRNALERNTLRCSMRTQAVFSSATIALGPTDRFFKQPPRSCVTESRWPSRLMACIALGSSTAILSPENILVDAQGHARLLGFGLAAPPAAVQHGPTTSDAPIQGTLLAYMAPEKTGRTCYSLDGRADLYSLGIILYEPLTGVQPFQASNAAEWVHRHLARRPVPPGEKRPQIPHEVSGLVSEASGKGTRRPHSNRSSRRRTSFTMSFHA